MSFIEDLKRWARGEDEEDDFEEFEPVSQPRRARAPRG